MNKYFITLVLIFGSQNLIAMEMDIASAFEQRVQSSQLEETHLASVQFPYPVKAACYTKDGQVIAALSGYQYDKRRYYGLAHGSHQPLLAVVGKQPRGDRSHFIQLYDLNENRPIETIETIKSIEEESDDTNPARSILFTDEDRLIITGTDNGVLLHDLSSSKSQVIKGPSSSVLGSLPQYVRCVALDPVDKNVLASGAENGIVCLWDLRNTKTATRQVQTTAAVKSVAFNSDGSQLVAGVGTGETGKLLFLARDNKKLRSIQANQGGVKSVTWHPTKNLLAFGGRDKMVKLWRPGSNPEHCYSSHKTIQSVSFTDNGMLVIGDDEGFVTMFDIEKLSN